MVTKKAPNIQQQINQLLVKNGLNRVITGDYDSFSAVLEVVNQRIEDGLANKLSPAATLYDLHVLRERLQILASWQEKDMVPSASQFQAVLSGNYQSIQKALTKAQLPTVPFEERLQLGVKLKKMEANSALSLVNFRAILALSVTERDTVLSSKMRWSSSAIAKMLGDKAIERKAYKDGLCCVYAMDKLADKLPKRDYIHLVQLDWQSVQAKALVFSQSIQRQITTIEERVENIVPEKVAKQQLRLAAMAPTPPATPEKPAMERLQQAPPLNQWLVLHLAPYQDQNGFTFSQMNIHGKPEDLFMDVLVHLQQSQLENKERLQGDCIRAYACHLFHEQVMEKTAHKSLDLRADLYWFQQGDYLRGHHALDKHEKELTQLLGQSPQSYFKELHEDCQQQAKAFIIEPAEQQRQMEKKT